MLWSSLICPHKTGEYLLWNGVTLSDPCSLIIVLLLFGLPSWLVVILFCWFPDGSLILVDLSFGCRVFIQLGINIWSASFFISMCLTFGKCWFFCFSLGGGRCSVLRHFLCSFCHCLSIVFIWELLLRVVFGFTCCSHAFGAQNRSLSWCIHSCGDFVLAISFMSSIKKFFASAAWFWSNGELSWFSLQLMSLQPPHKVYWAHLAGWSPREFSNDATSCLSAFASWPKCVLPFLSMISCLAALEKCERICSCSRSFVAAALLCLLLSLLSYFHPGFCHILALFVYHSCLWHILHCLAEWALVRRWEMALGDFLGRLVSQFFRIQRSTHSEWLMDLQAWLLPVSLLQTVSSGKSHNIFHKQPKGCARTSLAVPCQPCGGIGHGILP